ncbi:hypothetical protein HDE_01750 [Halotydeus destructor]|nr:hypothetical protein HDE_01750 [Halotydeus destructor]
MAAKYCLKWNQSVTVLYSTCAILCNCIKSTEGKGGATKGAAAGGGAGSKVSVDDFTGGHYTEEEMQAALVILTIILFIFFCVCSCQCYQRIAWECTPPDPKWPPIMTIFGEKRPMPCAPYNRDGTGFV